MAEILTDRSPELYISLVICTSVVDPIQILESQNMHTRRFTDQYAMTTPQTISHPLNAATFPRSSNPEISDAHTGIVEKLTPLPYPLHEKVRHSTLLQYLNPWKHLLCQSRYDQRWVGACLLIRSAQWPQLPWPLFRRSCICVFQGLHQRRKRILRQESNRFRILLLGAQCKPP